MINPPHPGAFVREMLHEYRLNVSAGALALGVSRVALSRFLNGGADLSPEMAIRIEKAFGEVSMETLMQMQAAYSIAQARLRAATIHVRPYAPAPDRLVLRDRLTEIRKRKAARLAAEGKAVRA